MPHAAFDEIRRYPIESLNLEFQEYQHKKTGAKHIHLASDDDQNAFLVAFLTVPQDSTGVAHILEHTFFPSLNELDFMQEGHRLDFTETGDIESPLMYKGVVFNCQSLII